MFKKLLIIFFLLISMNLYGVTNWFVTREQMHGYVASNGGGLNSSWSNTINGKENTINKSTDSSFGANNPIVGVQQMAKDNNYVYGIDWKACKVWIVNINPPFNLVDSFDLQYFIYHDIFGVAVDSNYIYTLGNWNGGPLDGYTYIIIRNKTFPYAVVGSINVGFTIWDVIAVDDSKIYVGSTTGFSVLNKTPPYTQVGTIASNIFHGNSTGICYNTNYIFISHSDWNYRGGADDTNEEILVYPKNPDTNGKYNLITRFGTYGNTNGQFRDLYGLDVDANYLYACDAINLRIQVFNNTPPFAYVTQFTYAGYPGGFNPADVKVTDKYIFASPGSLVIFNKTNKGFIESTDTPSPYLYPTQRAVAIREDLKADKVIGNTNRNFAGLDIYGNLIDSGYDSGDFESNLGFIPENIANKSMDTNMGNNTPSSNLYPSQKSVKIFANNNLEKIANKNTDTNLGINGSTKVLCHYGIAKDSVNSLIYVTDYTNNKLRWYNLQGIQLGSFGIKGNGDGQFTNPASVVIDNVNGFMYIADYENYINKFDLNRNFIIRDSWNGEGKELLALSPDGSYIYYSDIDHKRVKRLPTYNLGNYGLPWVTIGYDINGLDTDALGNVYILYYNTSVNRNYVIVYSYNLSTLIQTYGYNLSISNESKGMYIDKINNLIYIGDTQTQVGIYSLTFSNLGNFGSANLTNQRGIFVDSNLKKIYISDIGSTNIKIFDLDSKNYLNTLTGGASDTLYPSQKACAIAIKNGINSSTNIINSKISNAIDICTNFAKHQPIELPFSVSGILVTNSVSQGFVRVIQTGTLQKVWYGYLKMPSTNGTVIVDILKNGTSIFSNGLIGFPQGSQTSTNGNITIPATTHNSGDYYDIIIKATDGAASGLMINGIIK